MRSKEALAKRLVGASVLVVGMLMAAYGILAVLYRDGGGETYVLLVGRKLDADLVGACAIVMGAVAIFTGALFFRSSRSPAAP